MLNKAKRRLSAVFLDKYRVIVIGTDQRGKSAISKLSKGKDSVQTVGFNVQSFKYKNLELTIWDVGGKSQVRQLWRHYFQDTQGIIVVLNGDSHDCISEAKLQLDWLLTEDELKMAALLVVVCSSQDISTLDIGNSLGLSTVTDRAWKVHTLRGDSEEDFKEGLEWLSKKMF